MKTVKATAVWPDGKEKLSRQYGFVSIVQALGIWNIIFKISLTPKDVAIAKPPNIIKAETHANFLPCEPTLPLK